MAKTKTAAPAKMSMRAERRSRLFGREARRVGNFAMIFPGGKTASVSSAALQSVADMTAARKGKRSVDVQWQSRSYELLDEIGELGYLLNLKASIAARCLLPIQYLTDEGEWDASDDEKALRTMQCFVGPYGGQTELKRRAVLHLSAAGESYLVGEVGDQPETGILWEFLSTDEVRIDATGQATRRRDGAIGNATALPPDSYVARCWRPHPRFSDMADSEVRRVLQICEEIVTLTAMVDAVAKSRLAAGILFVPEEMTFADQEDETDESTDDLDPFTKTLMDHMSAPIEDRSSAASLVPLVLRGKGDMADNIKLIDVARNLDTWAQMLRAEALARLAQGLDTPPEVIAGKAQLNHWTAYNVDVDFVVKHVVPVGDLLAEFLTCSYLRPMLETFEDVSPEEAQRYRLTFDPSPVMARQDEATAARALHPLGVISDESLVKANGFDISDMPDDAELFRRRSWELVRSAPAVFAQVLLPLIPGFEDIDASKLGAPAAGGNGGGEDGQPGTPTSDATSGQEAPVPAFRNLVMQVAVAADASIDRAMERAGARLVTKSTRNLVLRDRLRAIDKSRALLMVTAGELASVGCDAASLLEGAWDQLSLRTRYWVRDYLVECGASEMQADDGAVLAAGAICEEMQAFVTAGMHVGFPNRANRLRVPEDLVVRALRSVSAASVA